MKQNCSKQEKKQLEWEMKPRGEAPSVVKGGWLEEEEEEEEESEGEEEPAR